jgi:hypothetical protein
MHNRANDINLLPPEISIIEELNNALRLTCNYRHELMRTLFE